MSIKCKIVQELRNNVEHRRGVDCCPHCDKGFDYDLSVWEKGAKEIVMEIVHGKHGDIAIVSECPKCFKDSWCHFSDIHFEDWNDNLSKEIKDAAREELGRRNLSSAITFADSLCSKCVFLRRFKCDTIPYVTCTLGSTEKKPYLHNCFTRTTCDKFSPRKQSVNNKA